MNNHCNGGQVFISDSNKLSSASAIDTITDMQIKSAPNEKEDCQGRFASKLGEHRFEESESLINSDLPNTTLDCDSTRRSIKPNLPLGNCSATPKLGPTPSSFKNSLQSGTRKQLPQCLIFHSELKKSQGKGTKPRNGLPPRNTGSASFRSTGYTTQDEWTEQREKTKQSKDFTFHPRVISNLSSATYVKQDKPKTHKNSVGSIGEMSFSGQDKLLHKERSSFHKNQSGCEGEKTLKQLGKFYCSTPQMKGRDYYKKVIDKNFKKQQLDESQFSYHPEILPVSKQRRPQTLDELCYGPIKKKEEDVKALRKECMEKANKECTFAPLLREDGYNNVNSKLKLKEGMNTYLQRMAQNRQKKEIKQRIYKELKEIEELTECTHTPKINRRRINLDM